MKTLLAFPILGIAIIFQMAVFSQINLLSGSVDVMLLLIIAWSLQRQVDDYIYWTLLGGVLVGFTSALPFFVPVIGFLISTYLARNLIQRIWQAPFIAMLIVTFFGTLIYHLISFVTLWVINNQFSFSEVLNRITVPSVFLNMLVSIPVYALVRDFALWLHPTEETE